MSTPFFPPPQAKGQALTPQPRGTAPEAGPYRRASQPVEPRAPLMPHVVPTAKKPRSIAVEAPTLRRKYLEAFRTWRVVRLILIAATIGSFFLLDCAAKAYLTR